MSRDAAIEVVVKPLDVDPQTIGALSMTLSDDERERARCLRSPRDRRRFIVARARLRELLAARLGLGPDAVALAYGANGKPRLASSSPWRFNVSHCDGLAVYAFSRCREIGIDVEAVKDEGDADAIASRFFSRRENAEYSALRREEKPLGFFNCWTRKEAVVKALGTGLSMPLDQFDVSLTPGEPARLLRLPSDSSGWRLDSFCPLPGFVAAVASHPGSK